MCWLAGDPVCVGAENRSAAASVVVLEAGRDVQNFGVQCGNNRAMEMACDLVLRH
jgi:hypothetical protein